MIRDVVWYRNFKRFPQNIRDCLFILWHGELLNWRRKWEISLLFPPWSLVLCRSLEFVAVTYAGRLTASLEKMMLVRTFNSVNIAYHVYSKFHKFVNKPREHSTPIHSGKQNSQEWSLQVMLWHLNWSIASVTCVVSVSCFDYVSNHILIKYNG